MVGEPTIGAGVLPMTGQARASRVTARGRAIQRGYWLRRFRPILTALVAAHLLVLTALAAGAQPRNQNSGPQRPAPALPPSGHQTEAVDLNEGATPAQMFSSACAVCHQGGGGGLAKGRSARDLANFLRQHYTTGQQQAGALSAYLTSGGLDNKPSRPARVEPTDRPPAAIGSRRPTWDDDDDPALENVPAERRRKPPSIEAARPPERVPAERRRPADAKDAAKPERPTGAARQQAGTKPAAAPPAEQAQPPAAEPAAAPPPEQKSAPEIPL